MELSELKSVINTPSRQKAFARVLTDEKIRRISLDGSATAAPADVPPDEDFGDIPF